MTYLIITGLLFALEYLYFFIANKLNIIDSPNMRSSHTRITLRGGGVVFLFGALIYSAFYGFQYPWFLAGLTMIAAISFMDDVSCVPGKVRLLVHFSSMLLLFYQLEILSVEGWWIVLISLIICTGIINAYNFMDGINGITGGYSLAILLPFMIVNAGQPFIDMNLIYVTGISVLVFCYFNYRTKAKCFAGDVGAVSIAFILLFMLGALIMSTGQLWYFVFFTVYGVDSILTICHRLLLHENIFNAHRKHAYQLMANELHIPHVTVSTIYMVLQIAVSLGAIYIPINKYIYFVSVLVILCLVYILFIKKYYHLHEAYLKSRP